MVKKRQFNDINAAEAEGFKQFKAWLESQGKDGYSPPWATKVNNVELGFKNRKVEFSDEVENTQDAKKWKLNPSDGIPTEFFASNGRQEVDDGYSDEMSDDPKNPAVITLCGFDIKTVSLLRPRSTKYTPPLAGRELSPPRKNSAWRHGQAGDPCEPLEKWVHDVMDRQAISVILKLLMIALWVHALNIILDVVLRSKGYHGSGIHVHSF